ncbi:MAG: hypothetical protein U0183_11450 [Polyangiaceae bacterium]
MTVLRWAGALLLVTALGCSRRDGAKAGEAGTGTPANETGSAATNGAPPERPNEPLVEASQVASCSVAHSCSLSHPGLGSSARGTRVDLGACTRTSWASSGPWKNGADDTPLAPTPPGSTKAPKVPEPPKVPVPPADCARLKSLVTSVTRADLRAAAEPAKMDTEACQLYVECGSPPTEALRVQRQTTTGAGRVTDLVRAVYGLP